MVQDDLADSRQREDVFPRLPQEVFEGADPRALDLYRRLRDWVAVARTAIVEANTLLASGQAEEAILKANLALGLIGPEDSRLELLARGIIIESHVIFGRPLEALHLFSRARPLFEGSTEPSTRLRVSFLEARLLVGLGNVFRTEHSVLSLTSEAPTTFT